MNAINLSISALNDFQKETESQYAQIIETSKEVFNGIGYMLNFLEQAKERLEKQIISLSELDEEIEEKIKFLQEAIEEAKRYNDDYDSTVSPLEKALENAKKIKEEIDKNADLFEKHLNIMQTVIDALTENRTVVNNLTLAIADEATYNVQSLSVVCEKAQAYVYASDGVESDTKFSKASPSYVGAGNVVPAQKETGIYKPKFGDFGFNTDGTRRALSVYSAYAPPVVNILYSIMTGLSAELKEAVMDRLGGVVFMSNKHPFCYGRDSRGQMIKILGIDASDADFSSRLLFHIGHHLHETNRSIEKLQMENAFGREFAKNSRSADSAIRAISDNFKHKTSHNKLNRKPLRKPQTPESVFFAKCFSAYATNDNVFLSNVKKHFGDSYNSFLNVINGYTKK